MTTKGTQSMMLSGELTGLRCWMTLHKNTDEMVISHDPCNRWRMTHEWETAYAGSMF